MSYAKFDGSILNNFNFNGAKLEKTITSLSMSQFWGAIKNNDKYRDKITRAHNKAVDIVKSRNA